MSCIHDYNEHSARTAPRYISRLWYPEAERVEYAAPPTTSDTSDTSDTSEPSKGPLPHVEQAGQTDRMVLLVWAGIIGGLVLLDYVFSHHK